VAVLNDLLTKVLLYVEMDRTQCVAVEGGTNVGNILTPFFTTGIVLKSRLIRFKVPTRFMKETSQQRENKGNHLREKEERLQGEI